MKPEDVGLSNRLQKIFNAQDAAKGHLMDDAVKGSPIVTYTTIYKCSNFSVRLDSSHWLINQSVVLYLPIKHNEMIPFTVLNRMN